MKKFIFILFVLIPILLYPQQNLYNSSPNDYMWMNVGKAGFSDSDVDYTCIAINGANGQPYVAFKDYYNNFGTSVMRFDGINWVYVGNPGFSGWSVSSVNLAFDSEGIPYVAYKDYNNSQKATVMKFDGTNWINVGNPGFSAVIFKYLDLAIDPSSDQPFIVYQEWTTSTNGAVMKFDGVNWVNVGTTYFTNSSVESTSIAIDASGQPYVAFCDPDSNDVLSVLRFDGTNWVYVGAPGFSITPAAYVNIGFSPFGELYVAFSRSGATVMKFNGTNWVYVGLPSFSAGGAEWLSLSFSPLSGQPYVAYRDDAFGFKASAMMFNGIDWVPLGSPGFSAGITYYESLAISPSGQVYVAYSDGSFPVAYPATVMKYDSVFVGTEETKSSGLSLYPNPSSTSIKILLDFNQSTTTNIEIIDIRGIKMFEAQTSEREFIVDVHTFPAGIYFIKVKGSFSTKVIKFCKT